MYLSANRETSFDLDANDSNGIFEEVIKEGRKIYRYLWCWKWLQNNIQYTYRTIFRWIRYLIIRTMSHVLTHLSCLWRRWLLVRRGLTIKQFIGVLIKYLKIKTLWKFFLIKRFLFNAVIYKQIQFIHLFLYYN